MLKLGWKVIKNKNSIRIYRTTNETEICLEFDSVGKKVHINLVGNGDLDHHLIEDCMLVINKLAEIRGMSHKLI